MPLRHAYALFSAASGPALRALLGWRRKQDKEDPQRLIERMGQASQPRPDGRLIWFHGASVGESQTVLPVIDALLAQDPELSVLITTGTRTSARLLAESLPPRAFHQYAPLDNPHWIRRFLAHWQPDCAIWIESELWPNMINLAAKQGVRLGLINARLSARSARRWRLVGRSFFASLLGRFDLILAQDEASARRFERDLGVTVEGTANLKQIFERPSPVPAEALAKIEALRSFPHRWLAASTHPGEEALVYASAKQLRQSFAGLLTVLAPRHPERVPELAAQARAEGLAVTLLSEWIPDTDAAPELLIVDRLGLLQSLYGAVPIAFLGGSMNLGLGGHNVFEALRGPTSLLFGPDMSNTRAVADALLASGAARQVDDGAALTRALDGLLAHPEERAAMMAAAGRFNLQDQHRSQAVLAALQALLDDRHRPGLFADLCGEAASAEEPSHG